MSITPAPIPPSAGNAPAAPYRPAPPAGGPPTNRPTIILAVIMILGFAGLGYYAKHLTDRLEEVRHTLDSTITSQGETLHRLTQRLEKTDSRTNNLEGTLTVTQNRLGMTQTELQRARDIASNLARQQQEASEKLGTQLSQLQQEQVSTKGAVGSLSTDVSGVKGEVQSTKQELAATKSQLQRVVGDLGVQSDLIARNRGDLEELRQRGERDYIEFDLRKDKKQQRVGPVQIQLKNADPKRQRYTVALRIDDKNMEKKDKTVSEPVQFYQRGYGTPSEIVVNQIYKDRIVGYLSTPKKKQDRTPMKAS